MTWRNKRVEEISNYKKSQDLVDISGYIENLKILTQELSEKDEKILSIQEDYKKIFNLFSDVVVLIDSEGNVIDLNRKAQVIFNSLEAIKIIGKKWKDIIEYLGCNYNKSIEKQVIESDVLKERSKEVYIDKLKKHFLISILPIRKTGDNDYFIFTARDITKIKEREQDLIKKQSLIKYIDYISDAFHRNFNINYIMEKIVEVLGKIDNVDAVYIYKNYIDENNKLYAEITKSWSKNKYKNRAKGFKELHYSNFPRWKEYFEANHIICGNINGFPKNEKLLLKNEDIKSICVVPIYTATEWWGFLGFDSIDVNKNWTFDEERILKIAANIIGSGIYQWTLRNSKDEILQKTCINF